MVKEKLNTNKSIKRFLKQESKCKCLSTERVLLPPSTGKAVSAHLYVLSSMCAISSCVTEISRKKDKSVWPPTSRSCCDNVVSDVPKTINCDSRPLARYERPWCLERQPQTSAYNFYCKSITWINDHWAANYVHPSVFLQELLNTAIDGLLKERKSSQLFLKSDVL